MDDFGDVVDYRDLSGVGFPTLQVSIGKLKYSMMVFSRIQDFMSFIFSNIKTMTLPQTAWLEYEYLISNYISIFWISAVIYMPHRM